MICAICRMPYWIVFTSVHLCEKVRSAMSWNTHALSRMVWVYWQSIQLDIRFPSEKADSFPDSNNWFMTWLKMQTNNHFVFKLTITKKNIIYYRCHRILYLD